MSTYAIGDVQGCFRTLQTLLASLQLRPDVDRVWLLGDLVGRGPDALSVLRFLFEHRSYVSAVLGNHDLTLLAAAHRLITPHANDKLDAALSAPDCEMLLEHLRRMPFVHRAGNHLLVHAGILPSWDAEEIAERADNAHRAIASPDASVRHLARFFRLPGAPAASVQEQRVDETLEIMTCIRTLDAEGKPYAAFKGELSSMPEGMTPWFRWPTLAWDPLHVCCGHWSALGLHREQHVTALDGGCVWGRTLCAMRLEDGALFEVQNAEFNA